MIVHDHCLCTKVHPLNCVCHSIVVNNYFLTVQRPTYEEVTFCNARCKGQELLSTTIDPKTNGLRMAGPHPDNQTWFPPNKRWDSYDRARSFRPMGTTEIFRCRCPPTPLLSTSTMPTADRGWIRTVYVHVKDRGLSFNK